MPNPATGPGIAVLGCGGWGINHVRTWHELGWLRVACDLDRDRLALVKESFPDLEVSDRPDEILARDDVAGVVVATPAVTHGNVASAALSAGKHVLVEKPLAVDLATAEKLLEQAESSRLVLMVGHVLEYHPAFTKLMTLVEEGRLGKILYLYSHRLNFGRVRTEENALWSFAPHDIALCLRLIGERVDGVACRGVEHLSRGVADLTTMDMVFADGRKAHIFVSWLHPFKEHRFVVVGEEQMAVFDDTAPWSEKLVVYPHRIEWLQGRVPVARKADAQRIPLEEAEPLRVECEAFLTAIQQGGQPLTDGTSGLEVLRVLDAGEASLRRNGTYVAISPGPHQLSDSPPRIQVHPSAVIDDGAEIGRGTCVWHFSHVMGSATVGSECSLGQNVFIGARVNIGDRVKIQNNVSVYEGVELEDDVFCGPSVVFTNVLNPRSEVNRKSEYRNTKIKKGASLGANSTLLPGVTVGTYAFVGAGATVTKDVPDFALVVGSPARQVGWMCRCGQKLPPSSGRVICERCKAEYESDTDGLLHLG